MNSDTILFVLFAVLPTVWLFGKIICASLQREQWHYRS